MRLLFPLFPAHLSGYVVRRIFLSTLRPSPPPAAAICMGRHTVKAPHKRQWRPLALSLSTRKLFREKLPAAWGMCQKALNASSRLHSSPRSLWLPIAAILPSSPSSIVSFGLTASAQCDSPSPSNQWTDGPQLILITPPPLPPPYVSRILSLSSPPLWHPPINAPFPLCPLFAPRHGFREAFL